MSIRISIGIIFRNYIGIDAREQVKGKAARMGRLSLLLEEDIFIFIFLCLFIIIIIIVVVVVVVVVIGVVVGVVCVGVFTTFIVI